MNILYLAQFAGVNETEMKLTEEEKHYANYQNKILEILNTSNHNIAVSNDLNRVIHMENKPEYIFTLYNRASFNNSEIFVSALAEYYKIPYLGARPNIRAIAEDKHLAKIMAYKANIHTAKWAVFGVGTNREVISIGLNFLPPYFIKPRYGASSRYISSDSIAHSIEEAIYKIQLLFDQNIDVIVEEYLEGTSYTVPLILDEKLAPLPLTPIKEESSKGVITYEHKRKTDLGFSRQVCQDEKISKTLHKHVLDYYELVKPLDYARLDFIVTPKGIPHFLEMNLCCNLGEQAAVALAAYSHGFTHSELVLTILERSLKRQGLTFE
ncbi:hypothetical protein ACFRAM_13725 [Paenibacillus sp. NPDC056722]|uniref:hypothetical protein n=1 Tax=Paenibacillus sp. NPDC056722 TaxID=3345924 RepID=UPI0036CCBC18